MKKIGMIVAGLFMAALFFASNAFGDSVIWRGYATHYPDGTNPCGRHDVYQSGASDWNLEVWNPYDKTISFSFVVINLATGAQYSDSYARVPNERLFFGKNIYNAGTLSFRFCGSGSRQWELDDDFVGKTN